MPDQNHVHQHQPQYPMQQQMMPQHQHQHAHVPQQPQQLAGQVQYIPMVQTAQGWVPYQPGMGQVSPAPVPAPTQAAVPAGGGVRLGTAILLAAGLYFGGKWLWDKAKAGDSGGSSGDGGRHRSREDHVKAREGRRSRSRMLAEFERFLESHASED